MSPQVNNGGNPDIFSTSNRYLFSMHNLLGEKDSQASWRAFVLDLHATTCTIHEHQPQSHACALISFHCEKSRAGSLIQRVQSYAECSKAGMVCCELGARSCITNCQCPFALIILVLYIYVYASFWQWFFQRGML